jgi:hypothetical protein
MSAIQQAIVAMESASDLLQPHARHTQRLLQDAIEALQDLQSGEPVGEVTVTKNESGQIVSVTRNDSEGRILSMIAESTPQMVVPEGYVLVPAEPTRAMLDAAIATPCAEDQDEDYVNMYKAMLSAGKEAV